jgi:hypothetical protein
MRRGRWRRRWRRGGIGCFGDSGICAGDMYVCMIVVVMPPSAQSAQEAIRSTALLIESQNANRSLCSPRNRDPISGETLEQPHLSRR